MDEEEGINFHHIVMSSLSVMQRVQSFKASAALLYIYCKKERRMEKGRHEGGSCFKGKGEGGREGEAATRPRRHKTEAAAHVRELAISSATRLHLTLFFLAFPSIPSSSFLTKQSKSCL